MAVAVRPRKLAGYEFYRQVLGSPKNIVAPMVDQSELPWRELSRKYGADLCYTPMINSGVFVRSETYRKEVFTTCGTDRPLIAQLCGNDPSIVLEAAQLLQGDVDAVDLNFGCPQNIARRGRYGAFLQDEWGIVSSLLSTLHRELEVPVTCKIRIFPDLEKTIRYAKMIQSSGCQLLTVHGRTIKQKGQLTGMADWEAIKAVKDAMDIPVFANGNILYAEDVAECIRQTGVDGVMVAEGNLADPSLFSTESVKTAVLTEEYIALAKKHNATWGQVKAHLFRMWHQCLTHHTDLRDRLGASCHSIADAEVVAAELKKRLEEEEAQGTDADGDGVIHNALSGPRPRPPRWVSQPKVRDVAKDSKVVANDKAARMKSNAAAKAEGERAYQTANGNGGGEGPAAARKLSETEIEGEAGKDKPPPNKKAKTRRIEAIKNGSGRWQFCETCKGNPRGSKCLHQLCKACCKIRFASDGAVCPPHKIYAGPPAHIAALKAAGKDPKEYAGPPSHVLAAQAEAAATAPAAGGANPPA